MWREVNPVVAPVVSPYPELLVRMDPWKYTVLVRRGTAMSKLCEFESHRQLQNMDIVWWDRLPYRVYASIQPEGEIQNKTLYVDLSLYTVK